MVALLGMGAETVETLAGMFVPADEDALGHLGGTVQVGIELVLERLAARRLVSSCLGGGRRWWELTRLGLQVAGGRCESDRSGQME